MDKDSTAGMVLAIKEIVLDYLRSAGFRRLQQVRLKSGLVILSKAAKQLLKDWDIKPSYWKLHSETLERH